VLCDFHRSVQLYSHLVECNKQYFVQAAHLTMPLEKRFGKRLQRASAQGDSDAVIPPQKKGRPTGKYQGSYRPKADSQLKCCLSMHLHCLVQGICALSNQILHVTAGCLLSNHFHSRQIAWLYASIRPLADTCNRTEVNSI